MIVGEDRRAEVAPDPAGGDEQGHQPSAGRHLL